MPSGPSALLERLGALVRDVAAPKVPRVRALLAADVERKVTRDDPDDVTRAKASGRTLADAARADCH
jgi:hypothetical protein